jgi:miniconductance mechanosensitive channel
MEQLITTWLTEQGLPVAYISFVNIALAYSALLMIGWLSYVIGHRYLLTMIHRIVSRTKNTWDDLLVDNRLFARLMMLVPLMLIMILAPVFLPAESLLGEVTLIATKVLMCFQVARVLITVLSVIRHVIDDKGQHQHLPVDAAFQVLTILIVMVGIILSISYISGKSPLILLSSLATLAAALLFVFASTIKGLVASIQISANRMVAPGDWISMPKYGADGDIIHIGLTTVKVKNFDKTVTTIPTVALIDDAFQNWRGMSETGARRIKRSLHLDVSSIGFCDQTQLEKLEGVGLLSEHLKQRRIELAADNQNKEDVDCQRLTNIGTFRVYIELYLKQHLQINSEMTCMVRQRQATPEGLPLEVYCFSNTTNWVVYEKLMSDIFDHLFAIAPTFNLRFFQHPTGHDWKTVKH